MFCTLDLVFITLACSEAAYVIFYHWRQTDCLLVLKIRFMVTISFHNLCRITICI